MSAEEPVRLSYSKVNLDCGTADTPDVLDTRERRASPGSDSGRGVDPRGYIYIAMVNRRKSIDHTALSMVNVIRRRGHG